MQKAGPTARALRLGSFKHLRGALASAFIVAILLIWVFRAPTWAVVIGCVGGLALALLRQNSTPDAD